MTDTSPGEFSDADPGRRYLTLMFADLSQSTVLAESMESEHYAAMLAALRAVYRETMAAHGGTVVRIQGDGLLAMFGHPSTREDDGRRAVEAALDLHLRVHNLDLDLSGGHRLCLHTGIHSGLVLLGKGDLELGRFELLGPVPNIAARLSDAAGPQQIMVSEETLGPASRFFVTAPPQLLQVRGKAAPILVYRVDARAGPGAGPGVGQVTGLASFVGRDGELAALERLLDEAMGGGTCSVSVTGPPGIGKTRLVEQFLGRAIQRGCQALRGYCDADLGAEPLQPFRHMLQTVADPAQPTTPEGFAALFARLARELPLLLFVDDWQWADDASNKVMIALRRQAQASLLIVVAARSGPGSAGMATTDLVLALEPLSDAVAMQAISSRLPQADPFVATEICRHASGNPLFIDELCHSAARGENGARGSRGHGGTGWLNRLVESRVQHLQAEQVELVRVAAVIGNVIPAWLLEQLTGHGANSPLLLGLAEMDFVFPGERAGTLRFKHGITRDIIYDSVGLHQRRNLHLRIAEAIRRHREAEPSAEALEALAFHFDSGGDAARAARYAELAGDKAHAVSALDRARAQYRVALGALERLPMDASAALRWVGIVQRLGRVSVFDSHRSELGLYRRALELAERHGDAATIGRARHWLGYILYGLGDSIEAIAQGEQALKEAEQAGDDKLRAQVVAALGEAHCAIADYRRALPLLDEAIEVKRRHRSGHHVNVGLTFSLVCRAYALGDQGRFPEAEACFDEALDDLRGLTHEIGATAHGWRSAVLLWQGRWADARAAADESGRIAEATRSLTQLSIARAIKAYAGWKLERRPEHIETLASATAWLGPRQNFLYRSLNHGWLADGLTDIGRRREARQHAAIALLRGRRRDLLGVAMAYRALARDAAAERPEAAWRCIDRAMQVARARDSAHELAVTQCCASAIALGQGDRARALGWVEPAATAFERMGMDWHLGEAQRLMRQIEMGTPTLQPIG